MLTGIMVASDLNNRRMLCLLVIIATWRFKIDSNHDFSNLCELSAVNELRVM